MSSLVICPPTLFRNGLLLLLEARLTGDTVVCEAWSPVVAAGLRTRPHLVLLDLDALGDTVADVTASLRRQFAAVPLVGLCDPQGGPSPAQACLRAGGTLCVLKSASPEVLLAALHAAESSMIFLPTLPGVGRAPGRTALAGMRAAPAAASVEAPAEAPAVAAADGPDADGRLVSPVAATTAAELGLTPKQRRVLSLLLEGMSAKNIARELGLCTGTVKTHTTAVLRALNVNTRVQAVVAARRMGLQVDTAH